MQTKSPAFDDLANLMTNAFGAVKGVGDEVKAAGRARAEAFIADMDLVSRDEFEVVKMMAANAQTEIAELKAEIAKLKTSPKAPKKRAVKPGAKPKK
ncbi:MAG: accessory factor UbiK family protein [Robiginitomaculum sp.]|nr:accessory factor UbiK family protein [Robiginitomaculum sp.]